jgi:phospholipase/carboxylesterase
MMSLDARLHARPAAVTDRAHAGHYLLAVGHTRDSYFYVPPGYDPARPAPLVLLLHGAGGHAHHGLGMLEHLADEAGLILVAPASSAQTWDVVLNQAFGTDVALVDRALAHVFEHYAIDPSKLAIGGFSDGASYALSLGLANGDLFTHVIAFSPGFIAPISAEGRPEFYISHGCWDDVLPIDSCSREIVPHLREAGYAVTYEEFEGGHTIPENTAIRAVDWFLGRR